MRSLGLALLVIAVSGGCGSSDSTDTGEWIPLFDGSGLDAFNVIGDANWMIEEGAAKADSGDGYLVSRESYADFDLEVEFWADEPANSGVFIRCPDPEDIGAPTCYEVNIFDTRSDQTYRTGAIVDVASPSAFIHASGRWNRFSITADGSRLTVELNGTTTVDAEDDRFGSGHIALQRAAGTIMFRNVRIRPR